VFLWDFIEFSGFCHANYSKAALGMGIAIDFMQWTG
jgi:hypothetical protein